MPSVKRGHLLVRIAASSVNTVDTMIRTMAVSFGTSGIVVVTPVYSTFIDCVAGATLVILAVVHACR